MEDSSPWSSRLRCWLQSYFLVLCYLSSLHTRKIGSGSLSFIRVFRQTRSTSGKQVCIKYTIPTAWRHQCQHCLLFTEMVGDTCIKCTSPNGWLVVCFPDYKHKMTIQKCTEFPPYKKNNNSWKQEILDKTALSHSSFKSWNKHDDIFCDSTAHPLLLYTNAGSAGLSPISPGWACNGSRSSTGGAWWDGGTSGRTRQERRKPTGKSSQTTLFS